MGSWSRTFLTYHDFCTGLRERGILNYFAGCRPWQQRVSGTFIVLQKFAAVIMIVLWQTAMSTLDNKSWKSTLSTFIVNYLVNLCGRESLCDIRRDCCHHFVSERDFERDAQRACKAERSLKSPPLAGTKRQALRQTSHEHWLSQVIVNFYC